MNYNSFRTAIANAIDSNGVKAITGKILQDAILSVVDALDLGALYLGEATTTTRPSSEANGFYLALQTGTYTHFQISVAKGEVALIVKTDSRWKKQVLTVMPYIDPATKHWIVNGEDSGVLAEGQQGQPGTPAESPFKGWFNTDNIPTTGQEGDYCYVDDDGTTKVWRWNPNAEPPAFEETTDTPDTDHTQTFASNESVNQVAIDGSKLVNPVNTADPNKPVLAKAEDVMQLKAKLEGVMAEETKVTPEIGVNIVTGEFIYGSTGETHPMNGYAYFETSIGTANAVRFLGGNILSSSNTAGYSLGYYDSNNDNTWVSIIQKKFFVNETPTTKELFVKITDKRITHFRTTCEMPSDRSLISLSNFYCYLYEGQSVVDSIDFARSGLTNIIFDGNDSSMIVPPKIPVKPGHIYRLSISNTELTIANTGMSGSNSKLWVGANNLRVGGTHTKIFSVLWSDNLQSEYEFIVPDDTQWLTIQMKFDAGQETVVSVEDITEIEGLKTELNKLSDEQLDVFSNGSANSNRYLFEKANYFLNCANTNGTSPYVASASSPLTIYCIIDVSGFQYVRFNVPLYKSSSSSTPAGWAFFTSENYTGDSNGHDGYSTTNLGSIEGAWDKFEKNTSDSFAQKELILKIPPTAKYLKTCISLSNEAITKNDFYCYLYNALIKEKIESDVILDVPDFYMGTWAPNTSYVKGNQVQYEEKYYYCTTGHTSSSTFNVSDGWAEITDFKFDCLNRYRFNKLHVGEKYYNMQSPIVDIAAFATSGTNVAIDEIYYNTNEHRLRRRFSSGANFYTIPYYKGVFYRYDNEIYIWNGSDLVKAVNVPNSSTFAILENDTTANRNISCADIVFGENPRLLLTGASFAYNNGAIGWTNSIANNSLNAWFELACRDMQIAGINKAVSGSSITNAANMAYKGTLWSMNSNDKNYIDAFDALVIMHVLNYDVMNTSLIRGTVEDYEANPDPNATNGNLFYVDDDITSPSYHGDRSSATIARSYDYLIKKYIKDCLSRKDVEGSAYHGKRHGKPVQIIMCTSWHDDRTTFNNSIRKLAASWGFPLVQFDANIGFTKNKPLSNGDQVSTIYSHGDTESIGGVVYGWHPMRVADLTENSESLQEIPYIQLKMAKIFENSFK